jgi:hypothetical protein
MHFSFARFTHLFVKQWKENQKAYLLGSIALPLFIAVVSFGFAYSSNLSEQNQSMLFTFGLIIIGGLFCSTLLSDYAPKGRAIRTLILPTTSLEKLLVAMIYGLLLFPCFYVLVSYPILKLVNYVDFEMLGNLYVFEEITGEDFLKLILAATAIFSFVFLCSLFFRKFIFIKAAITFVCLIVSISVANTLITKITFGDRQPVQLSETFKKSLGNQVKAVEKSKFELKGSSPLSSVEFIANAEQTFYVSANAYIGKLFMVITILFIPIMLIASFFRLKEIEL